MKKGERTLASGIILRNDDGKEHGVRNRWAQVYAVGSKVRDLSVGDWVCIEHGRWSRAIKVDDELTLWRADPESVLMVSDEEPDDTFVGTSTESGFAKEFNF